MPELPEVETVRRGLERDVVGRRFERVSVGRERTVRRTSARAVIDGLEGTTLVAARRRGKYLLGELDSGDGLMVHLRMSGQLLVAPADSPRPPHTHVVAELSGPAGQELRFVDPRTFGEVVVYDPQQVEVELPELARLGPDPIAEGLGRNQLAALMRGRSRQLKAALLDQSVIAGLGNIYTDEILHRSRLHPFRATDSLNGRQITVLHTSIHQVLEEAIRAGGSTLPDAQYLGLGGEVGWFQHEHLAYGRAGLPCLTCGKAEIQRLSLAGRSTFVCPRCQR